MMLETSAPLLIATALCGLTLSLVVTGIGQLLAEGRPILQRRARSLLVAQPEPEAPATRRLLESLAHRRLFRRLAGGAAGEMDAAGIGTPVGMFLFLAVRVLLAITGLVSGVAIGLAREGETASIYAAAYGLLGLLTGPVLPRIWLDARRRRRLEAIQLSLPDVIDLLVVCVEAGMGLNGALVRVAAEMADTAPELCEELNRLNQEIRTGVSRIEALRLLSRRIPVPDLESVTGVLIQVESRGGSIARLLRNQARLLRTRRRQRAEALARQATVKLILPLVFCIFPVILIVLLGPALYDLFGALLSFGGP